MSDPFVLKRNIECKIDTESNLKSAPPVGLIPGQRGFAKDTGNIIQRTMDISPTFFNVMGEESMTTAISTAISGFLTSQRDNSNGLAGLDADGLIDNTRIRDFAFFISNTVTNVFSNLENGFPPLDANLKINPDNLPSIGVAAALEDVAELDVTNNVKTVPCRLYGDGGATSVAFDLEYVVHSRGKLTTITIPQIILGLTTNSSTMLTIKLDDGSDLPDYLVPSHTNQYVPSFIFGGNDGLNNICMFGRYQSNSYMVFLLPSNLNFLGSQTIYASSYTFMHL